MQKSGGWSMKSANQEESGCYLDRHSQR